ncbi:MAG: hypothetical protein WCJ33_05500 [Pseudomonadota bacterium]
MKKIRAKIKFLWFRLLRINAPKLYIRNGMARSHQEYKKKLENAKNISVGDRADLEREYQDDIWQWQEHLSEIEDKELVEKAKKIEVYLDDITLPELDKDDYNAVRYTHYRIGTFGDRFLDPNSKKALLKNYRERIPVYRKERREIIDLRIKIFGLIGTFIVSAIGALTGLLAVYSKCGIR